MNTDDFFNNNNAFDDFPAKNWFRDDYPNDFCFKNESQPDYCNNSLQQNVQDFKRNEYAYENCLQSTQSNITDDGIERQFDYVGSSFDQCIQEPSPSSSQFSNSPPYEDEEEIYEEITTFEKIGSTTRANFTKNYKKILTKTFAEFFLRRRTPNIQKMLNLAIGKYPNFFNLLSEVLDYIKNCVDGKIKVGNSRQYKIQSNADILNVFHENDFDNDGIFVVKRVVRSLFINFLRTNTYRKWVIQEFETKDEAVRRCYLRKDFLEEIIKVFNDPKETAYFK